MTVFRVAVERWANGGNDGIWPMPCGTPWPTSERWPASELTGRV